VNYYNIDEKDQREQNREAAENATRERKIVQD